MRNRTAQPTRLTPSDRRKLRPLPPARRPVVTPRRVAGALLALALLAGLHATWPEACRDGSASRLCLD